MEVAAEPIGAAERVSDALAVSVEGVDLREIAEVAIQFAHQRADEGQGQSPARALKNSPEVVGLTGARPSNDQPHPGGRRHKIVARLLSRVPGPFKLFGITRHRETSLESASASA